MLATAPRIVESDNLETPEFPTPPPAGALALATPVDLYRVATDAAGVCREIVQRTARQIQRRRYVVIEGWQAIATAHGCVLSVEQVAEDADGNVTAVAAVRRMADGVILAKAEGFVGTDEETWRDRARYARRAMAQTRAMSRAARSAFAHVVVLIDAGLSTTPAEEVPARGFADDESPRRQQQQQPQPPRRPGPAPVVQPPPFVKLVRSKLEDRGLRGAEVEAAVRGIAESFEVSDLSRLGREDQARVLRGIAQGHADKYRMAQAG